jgi:translation initiation factor 4G
VDIYFNKFEELSKDIQIEKRLRYLIKDLIDLRHNNWERGKPLPSTVVTAPKRDSRLRTGPPQQCGMGNKPLQTSPIRSQTLNTNQNSPGPNHRKITPSQRGGRPRPIEFREKNSKVKPETTNIYINNTSLDDLEGIKSGGAASTIISPTSGVCQKEVERLVESLLREYLEAQEPDTAVSCFKDIRSDLTPMETINKTFAMGLETNDQQRKLLLGLLSEFLSQELLLPNQIIAGFEELASQIEDISIDVPRAPKYFGFYLHFFLFNSSVLDPTSITKLLKNLVPSGIASQVTLELLNLTKALGVEESNSLVQKIISQLANK